MKAYQGITRSLSEAPRAVVAIKETQADCFHVGIIHRSDDNQVAQMLHLAWHYDLRNEPAGTEFFWVEPGFPARRARQVASYCRLVALKNVAGLPYAFSDPGEAFDPRTGEFLLGPTKLGLTCATFVLAVFEAAGQPLADLGSWPSGRDEDVRWQERILEHLENNGAPPEHIASLRGEVGYARYHPTEVAAASSIPPPPATLEQVRPCAEELRLLITDRTEQRLALLRLLKWRSLQLSSSLGS